MYDKRAAASSDALLRRRLLYVGGCVVLALLVGVRLAARSRDEAFVLTVERMGQIEEALDRYAIDNGGIIPTTIQGLRGLLQAPKAPPAPRNWRGPYLSSHKIIFDGWGRKLHYVAPGGGNPQRPYDLWSLGRDNVEGGSGADADVRFWEPETLTQ